MIDAIINVMACVSTAFVGGLLVSFISREIQKSKSIILLKSRNLIKHRESDGVLIWRDDETEVKL